MYRRAFSLTEILVVVIIIVLLAALMFPVLTSAKKKAKEIPCKTNLRNVHTAWAIYTQENDDQMPMNETLLWSLASAPAFKCTLDTHGGVNGWATKKVGATFSYYYMPNIPDFRKALYEADPNHGIFYCVLHGETIASPNEFDARRDTTGTVIRLRRDGSIEEAKVGHMCSDQSLSSVLKGRQEWSLLTPKACVEPYCFGLTEPCKKQS